jgi:hypothetical protein
MARVVDRHWFILSEDPRFILDLTYNASLATLTKYTKILLHAFELIGTSLRETNKIFLEYRVY